MVQLLIGSIINIRSVGRYTAVHYLMRSASAHISPISYEISE